MRVGFIGLGEMGRPMAQRLLRAGHDLAVWARRPEAVAPLLDEGASAYASPAELAARSEVVFSIVTNSADVEAIAFGPDGLGDGLAAGAIHVDMSTIAPQSARALARRYAERDVGWLDAPVSGGGAAAADGTLAIMAGGHALVLERVMPLLATLGSRVVHVGGAGAGQVAKACNQMIMVAAIEAAAEAMHLARAHGVDVEAVRKALLGGSAGSRVLEVFGERMARRNFSAGIQARLHHKDFGIVLAEAVRLGVPLPIAAQVCQQLNALMAAGWGGEDTASLLRVLEAQSQARIDE